MTAPHWLLVDVGNTHTVAALTRADAPYGEFVRTIRFRTDTNATADEYRQLVLNLLLTPRDAMTRGHAALPPISRFIVSSVVPLLDPVIREAASGLSTLFVHKDLKSGFTLDLPHPEQLGADRLANVSGALALSKPPFLIVDAGTATTFCAVDAESRYFGGAITPGLEISWRALASRAAKLFSVPLVPPASSLGNTTESQIQSGVLHGYEALIEGMCERLNHDGGSRLAGATWFATGGCIHYLKLSHRFQHEPNLTLIGLQRLGRMNG
jgi:type III pantothenate kinase